MLSNPPTIGMDSNLYIPIFSQFCSIVLSAKLLQSSNLNSPFQHPSLECDPNRVRNQRFQRIRLQPLPPSKTNPKVPRILGYWTEVSRDQEFILYLPMNLSEYKYIGAAITLQNLQTNGCLFLRLIWMISYPIITNEWLQLSHKETRN